jgi:hypothetical protein
VELHEAATPLAVMAQVTPPLGAVALADPVTVALNVIAPPNESVPVEVSAIIGVASETTVAVGEVTVAIEK